MWEVWSKLLGFFLCLLLGVTSVSARQVRVFAELYGASGKQMSNVTLAANSLGSDPSEQRFGIKVPGETQVELAGELPWRLEPEAEGFWAPNILLPSGQDFVRIQFRQLIPLRANLEVKPDGPLPSALRARLQTAAAAVERGEEVEKGEEVPSGDVTGEFECAVEDGVWNCPLPEGNWDIRLHSKGFVSHFLWNMRLDSGEARDLGTLHLEAGYEVFGHVRTEDASLLPERCRVEAMPALASQVRGVLRQKVERQTIAANVNPKGFFHLKDLAVGSYTVTAHGNGFVPTRHNVVVEDDSNAAIDDLVLRRPLDLEVRITPPSDTSGKTWKLLLMNAAEFKAEGTGSADEEGRWRLSPLAPGTYVLFIADAFGTRVAQEAVNLAPGQTFFHVQLDTVWVDGELHLGEEPLSAKVYFGGRNGEISIPMSSDGDGKFAGWLPRAGEWKVDVKSEDPDVFSRLTQVDLSPEDGVARVDLRLPDTLLSGEVVDDQGGPAAGASILIARTADEGERTPPSSVRADAGGLFSLRGQSPGVYRLEARVTTVDGIQASEPSRVELSENAPSTSVRLIVRSPQALRGRVVAGGRGVAGAAIFLTEIQGENSRPLFVPETQTAVDGSFALDMPAGARHGTLLVLATGYTFHRQALAMGDGTEPLIELRTEGGTLIIQRHEKDGQAAKVVIIGGDGGFYDPMILNRWAAMNGILSSSLGTIKVPLMPPDTYSVCWSRDDCQQGLLNPGSELVLSPKDENNEKGAEE